MNVTAYPALLAKLKKDDYLSGFVSASARHWITRQIRTRRNRNSWSQKQLGEAAGKPQNVISRIEDPSYGKVTLQTLIDLAVAFRVGLVVKFVSFGELAAQMDDISPETLAVLNLEEEIVAGVKARFSQAVMREGATSTTADFTNNNVPAADVLSSVVDRGAHLAAQPTTIRSVQQRLKEGQQLESESALDFGTGALNTRNTHYAQGVSA